MAEIFVPDSMRDELSVVLERSLGGREVVGSFRAASRRRGRPFLVVGECPRSFDEISGFFKSGIAAGLEFVGIVLLARACGHLLVSGMIEALRARARGRLPTTFVAGELQVVGRVVRAHLLGGADKLIASASLVDDKLLVWSCEPRLYRIDLDDLPSHREMDKSEASCFTLSASGSRLHWEHGDLDVTLDDIRYVADPGFRAREDRRRRREIKELGAAVRSLRKSRGLTQKECGITEREMRRIENGQVVPHPQTLEKLARAHGMRLQEYFDSAREFFQLVEEGKGSLDDGAWNRDEIHER